MAEAPPPMPPPVPPLNRTRTFESKEESNLCRICRGEATEHEPLYHPCKCSGSIMYVHQECLMEWLSHSQKKHCELCKTSFRFTKLYAPNMPEKLPTTVFLRKAAAHTAQNVLYWLRGCLVTWTWTIWLPWTMRFVWWGLFWLADVGWVKDPNTYARDINNGAAANGTMAASNLTSADVNSALVGEILRGPAILRLTSWMLRLLATNPAKGVLHDLTPDNHMQAQLLAANSTLLDDRGTLLSGVSFLASLTSSPLANRVIIDVLEGQIITIALVALIILVLLIREWVVQQQPIANLINENDEVRQALQRHAREGEQRPRRRPLRMARRASILAREPDDLVKAILEEQRQEEGSGPSLDKTEESNLRNLHARIKALKTTLKEGFLDQLNANNGPKNVAQTSAALLLSDIEETSMAFRVVYANAVKDEDLAKLRSTRRNLHLFRRTLDLLPEGLAKPMQERTGEIRNSMKDMSKMVKIKLSVRGLGAPPQQQGNTTPTGSSQEVSTQAEVEVSDSNPTANEESEGTPRGRPTMPPRDESFVATEIQRNLEEGTSDDEPVDLAELERAEDVPPGQPDGDTASESDGYENVHHMTEDISQAEMNDEYREAAAAASAENDQDAVIGERESNTKQAESSQVSGTDQLAESDPAAGISMPTYNGDAQTADASSDRDEGSSNGLPAVQAQAAETEEGHHDELQPEAPRSVVERATDWLWGDLELTRGREGNNDDAFHEDAEEIAAAPENAEEAVTPPAEQQIGINDAEAANNNEVPPEENGAAVQPQAPALFGDIEGMDDAEDLEGVMELIGMQGPLTSLLTNAMFAAVFVSCTIVIAAWTPFLLGKIALIMLAHPISVIEAPFALVTYVTNITYDVGVLMAASALQWLVMIPIMYFINNWYEILPTTLTQSTLWSTIYQSTVDLISRSSHRLLDTLRFTIEGTDVAYSSLTFDSHSAVRALEYFIARATTEAAAFIANLAQFSPRPLDDLAVVLHSAEEIGSKAAVHVTNMASAMSSLPASIISGHWTITYKTPNFARDPTSIAPEWTALDRSLAISLGYCFIALMGALYFMRLAPVARSRQNKKIEQVVLEVLQQAGGIAKVVLIISIEMLVFPLYCGLLLDIALLPLFRGSSIGGRIDWSKSSPWTSLFVHWFIGTAYMFHFALFVAMCRKIFRKGVLYFIRDPDDPTFHPVRDVLERSVISQLRKIMSSAMIYGGLVIVCIGTLVWSLGYGLQGILPIQWKPTSAANAFPLDMLVYLFIRPFAIKYFALSDWLQDLYKWFFRRTARSLRLSHFLLGEELEEERGPIERRGFSLQPKNGRWLRVPANDGVRIPRGIQTFVDVDQDCRRIDGSSEPEYPEGKSFKEEDYTKVFVPHLFRLHLAAFIICVWSMTAVIGMLFTIMPLVLGRIALSGAFGRTTEVNDVYAFAIGVFVVCSATVMAIKTKDDVVTAAQAAYRDNLQSLQSHGRFKDRLRAASRIFQQACANYGPQIARCCYFYGVLGIIVSLTLSALLHLYILGPTATAMYGGEVFHVVKLSESLVIGIQFVRVISGVLSDHAEWRSTRAVDAILEDGPFQPKLALANRYLFAPLLLLAAAALVLPAAVGRIVSHLFIAAPNTEQAMYAQVFSYPAALGLALLTWLINLIVMATSRWRMRIRDEVFLIGERLHNYGEKKPPPNAPHSKVRV